MIPLGTRITDTIKALQEADTRRVNRCGGNVAAFPPGSATGYRDALGDLALLLGVTDPATEALQQRLTDCVQYMSGVVGPCMRSAISALKPDDSRNSKELFAIIAPLMSTTPGEKALALPVLTNDSLVGEPETSGKEDLTQTYDLGLLTHRISISSPLDDTYNFDNLASDPEEAMQLRAQLLNLTELREVEEKEYNELRVAVRTQVEEFREALGALTKAHHEIVKRLGDLPTSPPVDSAAEATIMRNGSSQGPVVPSPHLSTLTGSGMDLIWSAIDTVLRNEYDVRGTAAFRADFSAKVTSVISDDAALSQRAHTHSAAAALYKAGCAEMSVKPNSGVIRLLGSIGVADEATTTELNLSSNYLGTHSIAALLPVLRRLSGLQMLDLSNNGLRNESVMELLKAVRQHPSLTHLNLSQNKITRTAGREALSLIAMNPRIKVIDVNETYMDDSLRFRIQHRLSGKGPLPLPPRPTSADITAKVVIAPKTKV